MKKIILLLGLALTLTACGNTSTTDSGVTTEKAEATEQVSVENTEEATEETTEGTTEEATSKYEITDLTVEESEYELDVVGVLKNNTGKKVRYIEINVPVYDADGNKVGECMTNVTDLGPDETWKFKAMFMGAVEEGYTPDLDKLEVSDM